jgi:hypothetical protein
MDRYLKKNLQTHFSAFLEKNGFAALSDPELDKVLGPWGAVFHSDSLDLKFAGRGEILIEGRPVYRREDWCSISAVLALLAGESEARFTEADLGSFARKLEEDWPKVKHFFSAQGEELRSKLSVWEEQYFWRSMGANKAER